MTGAEVLIAVQIASAAAAAAGAMQQAKAASDAANFNAQVANNNAIATRAAAAENAKREGRAGDKRLGAIRARGGMDQMDLLVDSAMEEELGIQSMLHAGKLQATGFANTALLDTASASNARTSGNITAASTLLSGAAGAGTNYLDRQPAGGTTPSPLRFEGRGR
tara:strand:- start:42 stop:536 length:495 start_codon:yes stop_codon:yes gene_type:complete